MAGIELRTLQAAVWQGSLPLEVRLANADSRVYDKADPYLIHVPRVSYLPFLLPRLHAFFAPVLINPEVQLHTAWFSFEGVPLRWYHPLGLLYDLFSGPESSSKRENDDGQRRAAGSADNSNADPLPWKLTVNFSNYPYDQLAQLDAEGKAVHDAFINTVKEADFLRFGTAKGIMSLSKDDSTAFYQSVQVHDMAAFNRVNQRLMPAAGGLPLKHVPIRFYLPSSQPPAPSSSPPPKAEAGAEKDAASEATAQAPGHLRIVQTPIPPTVGAGAAGRPQTLGTALNAALPSLFPSRNTPILAKPVLHGAVVPMGANLEDLMRSCAYLDGWLHVSIEMMA